MSQIDEPVRGSANVTGGGGLPQGEASIVAAAPGTRQLTQSYAAFLRDLPELLAEHPWKWVAYAGDVQLRIGASKRALYQQCIAAGYRDGGFLICGIEPPQEVVLDDLLDV